VMFIAVAMILMTVIPDLVQMVSNAADAFRPGDAS